MVWLVQPTIDKRMMQSTVNPIDSAVSEADKEGVLQPVVTWKWRLACEIVEFGPSTHLCKEEGCCEDGHDEHRGEALVDLLLDLVWEVSWVF